MKFCFFSLFFSLYSLLLWCLCVVCCVCVVPYISSLVGDLFLFPEFFSERENDQQHFTFGIKNKKENKQSENVNIGTFSALAHNRIPKEEMGKKKRKGVERKKKKIWKSIGCKLAWLARAQKEREREKFKTVAIKNPKKDRELVRRSRYGRTRQRACTISIQNKINISIVMRHNHLQLFV